MAVKKMKTTTTTILGTTALIHAKAPAVYHCICTIHANANTVKRTLVISVLIGIVVLVYI